MNPKHSNPTQPNRTAHAPYNFVPLPEKIVRVDYSIPGHDTYTGHTGYLECTLATLSPTYTRAALDPEFFARWADNIREMMRDGQARQRYAQFFCLDDAHRPVIPGSSLRGMTRALIEIVGYGKIQWVTRRRLFFRTVDNTAVGKHYRDRMTDKVEGGFLRKRGEQYSIRKCHIARVRREKLGGKNRIYEGRPLTPRWTGKPAQYIPVWVELSTNRRFVQRIEYQQTDGLQEGRLIITGDVPRKNKEFVFLLPEEHAEQITVADELVERFHDEDQITQWQERAFSTDRPRSGCRQDHGMLRKDRFLQEEGDPVFFLRENGEIVFFGRAQMFRLPYAHSSVDLVPADLRQQDDSVIDLPEAIFGYVPEGGRTTARAGRVYFTDAVCEPNQRSVWLSEDPITLQILASPKPTTFQHYLVQDEEKGHNPDNKRQLAHYGTPTSDETVIRGHKLYWHKQEGLGIRDFAESGPVDWDTDTQRTQIKPVKAGVTFRFRVYFENLCDFELGALLWSLALPGEAGKDYCHSLGIGKPLGLGSVKITPTLYLSDRTSRYTQLFAGTDWHRGEKQESDLQSFIRCFEDFVLKRMDAQERGQAQSLREVERIKMLLKMLEWPGPDRALTEYMVIEPVNEFKERPVLPDPLHIEEPVGAVRSSSPRRTGGQRRGDMPDKSRGTQ